MTQAEHLPCPPLEETQELYSEYAPINNRLEQAAPYAKTKPTAEPSRQKHACDTTIDKKVDTKDNRTVTFAPSHRPPDDLVSDVTQSGSTTIPHTRRGIIATISIISTK